MSLLGGKVIFPKRQWIVGPVGKEKEQNLNSFVPRNGSFLVKKKLRDFPGGAVVKNPPANAGDTGSRPGPGRFPQAAEQ